MTIPYPSILPSFCPYGLFIQIPCPSIPLKTSLSNYLFSLPMLASSMSYWSYLAFVYCIPVVLSFCLDIQTVDIPLCFRFNIWHSCPLMLLCLSSNILRFCALLLIHNPSILLYLCSYIQHFCTLILWFLYIIVLPFVYTTFLCCCLIGYMYNVSYYLLLLFVLVFCLLRYYVLVYGAPIFLLACLCTYVYSI